MEALLNEKPVIMTDFMLEKTFPNSSRIIGVKPAYDDILDITPKLAEEMGAKVKDKSTKEFVENILKVANDIDKYKKGFNIKDYEFLSTKRMAQEYIEYIKL